MRIPAVLVVVMALAACNRSEPSRPSRASSVAAGPSAAPAVPAPSSPRALAPAPSPSAGSAPTATAGDLAFCVAETNRYRAEVGAAPLAASPAIDAYAARAAAADAASGRAHGYTNGPQGPPSFAENEVVRWSLADYGSVRGVIVAALAAFWEEGPGGAHYENMRGDYSAVGCGVAVDGDAVTVVQHFR